MATDEEIAALRRAAGNSQDNRLDGCSHILPCVTKSDCRRLEAASIERIKLRNAEWERSKWGGMRASMQMSLAWKDMLDALGDISDEQMCKLRDVLGEDRFRLLLNAYERLGGLVLEVPEVWPAPVVLP